MAKSNNVITFSDEQAMILQSARDFYQKADPSLPD